MTCPVVVPTQFVLEGDTVWLRRVRANPVFDALAENPRVVLSVADDWAFIPSSWKAIGQEDPTLGIPATYYGAVQLIGTRRCTMRGTDPGAWRASCGASWRQLRRLRTFQSGEAVANPEEAHTAKLIGVRRMRSACRDGRARWQKG